MESVLVRHNLPVWLSCIIPGWGNVRPPPPTLPASIGYLCWWLEMWPLPVSCGVASLLYESALGAKQYAIFLINQNLNLPLRADLHSLTDDVDLWCVLCVLNTLLCWLVNLSPFIFPSVHLPSSSYFLSPVPTLLPPSFVRVSFLFCSCAPF